VDQIAIIRAEIKRRIADANWQSDFAEGLDRSFVLGKLSALYEIDGFIAGAACEVRELRVTGVGAGLLGY
jgi:hypothetical protein